MKLLKLANSVGVAAVTAIGLALPSGAQPSPTTVPTTNLVGDYTVGPTYNGAGGNFWSYGTTGLQAVTSDKWAILAPVASLVQNTTLTIPDGGSATDTFLTAKSSNTITGTFTFTTPPVFPLAGAIFTGTNFNGTVKVLNAIGQATVFTIPDPGAATANFVLDAGTQVIGGTKSFSTALTSTSVNSAIQNKVFTAKPTPGGGAVAANTTVYFAFIYPGRAWTVKQIGYATHVDPVSGTNTVKVLKATASGNTMLNAASVSLNGTVIDTNTVATLTATGADLSGTATQPIYCEYSAGTQGAAARDVTVEVEVQFTDY